MPPKYPALMFAMGYNNYKVTVPRSTHSPHSNLFQKIQRYFHRKKINA